jgi:gliding motility associated protien GldN
MKNIVYFLLLINASFGFSQFNLLNADSPEEVGFKNEKQESLDKNEPLEYPYVDDKDILWSKIVYEYIDGYEQFNYPLFYPLSDSEFSNDRKSLWRILRELIYEKTRGVNDTLDSEMNEKPFLEVYHPAYRNFNVKYQNDLRARPDSIGVSVGSEKFTLVEGLGLADVNFDGIEDENDINYLISANIVGYNIKGLWYFDKKYGELRYRLIGIQPVGYQEHQLDTAFLNYNNDLNAGKSPKKPTPVEFFWLWYKDIREELHNHYIFSDKNNSKRISFDQLLLSRKFHTYLYRIDNIMDDRALSKTPYVSDNLYLRITESQRLKDIIRNFEHDMWSN